MDLSEELADLGAQLQQVLLDAYQARAGAQTVLAFLPETAVPSTLVQQGQVNPLQVTTWLGLVADTPLLLRTDQAAVIGGPSGGLDQMTDIYGELVRFATPVAAPGTPEALRVADEIALAQVDAGGGQLPLAASPSDWPLPNPDYWTHFTYTPAPPPAGSTGTPTGTPTGSTGSTGTTASPEPVQVFTPPDGIWRLQVLTVPPPVPVSPDPPDPPGTGVIIKQQGPDLTGLSGLTLTGVAGSEVKVADTEVIPEAHLAVDAVDAVDAVGTGALSPRPIVIDRPGLWHFPVFPVKDPPPPVTTAVTELSLDHMLVIIDRSLWWHNDLVRDPGWYVAGLPRGAWVGVPPAADAAYALPVALLLVQNLTMSGSWSSDETATLTAPGMMLGPFHLGGAAVSGEPGGSTSISVPGMHLAGLFCQPLPVLPPNDPPAGSS